LVAGRNEQAKRERVRKEREERIVVPWCGEAGRVGDGGEGYLLLITYTGEYLLFIPNDVFVCQGQKRRVIWKV
jgi:hypothetical protein